MVAVVCVNDGRLPMAAWESLVGRAIVRRFHLNELDCDWLGALRLGWNEVALSRSNFGHRPQSIEKFKR
jgi:hypothetical protein